MTIAQINARYPNIRLSPIDSYGFQQTNATYSNLNGAASTLIQGVDLVSIKAIDGRVVYLQINYDDSSGLRSASEFAGKLAQTLSLPNAWQTTGNDNYRSMMCRDFWIKIETYSRPTVRLEQLKWEKIIEARRRAKEERKRLEFKP